MKYIYTITPLSYYISPSLFYYYYYFFVVVAARTYLFNSNAQRQVFPKTQTKQMIEIHVGKE